MGRTINGGNTSQSHGIEFEDRVRRSGRFPKAENAPRSGIALIDIDAEFDPILRIDTSVKITGSGTIGLADAVRFYEIDRPFRFLVGSWVQRTGSDKSVVRMHEMLVPMRILDKIRGDVTAAEILDMHNEIASFGPGIVAANAARARRDEIKRAAAGRHGLVNLDFKIDSRKQRRLQLTIRLKPLIDMLKGEPDHVHGGIAHPLYREHRDFFHSMTFPVQLASTKRRIIKPGSTNGPTPSLPLAVQIQPARQQPNPATLRTRSPVRRDEAARQAVRAAQDASQPRLFG